MTSLLPSLSFLIAALLLAAAPPVPASPIVVARTSLASFLAAVPMRQ